MSVRERPDWPWFESRMTYANAVLPHALFDAAERWPDESFLAVAESSFAFLDLVTTADNVFWPIGNRDWYPHGEEKSLYDQQPVEAATMAERRAGRTGVAGRRKISGHLPASARLVPWPEQPRAATGRCSRAAPASTAFTRSGVNRNQGAESTLAYLWTELHSFSANTAAPRQR